MTYKKSSARSSFEETISLLMRQKKSAITGARKNHDLCQFVYRSMIFQSSAALEEYLYEVLASWLHRLDQQQLEPRGVPKEILALLIKSQQERHYKKFMIDRDEASFLRSIKADLESSALFGVSPNSFVVKIPGYLVSDKKYPSVENVSILFARFGLPNIFARLGESGKKDYKRLLQSFGDIRTELAHQRDPRSLTERDLNGQLDFLRDFVKNLDRIVYKQVVKLSGKSCWITEAVI